MHPYVIVPLAACVICSAFAIALLVRDPFAPSNRVGAVLIGGMAWWAFCEVLWNLAPDAVTAHRFVLLSMPSWCFIGPTAVHLFLEAGSDWPRLRRALPFLYCAAAVFLLVGLITPWLIADMQPMPWGYAYTVGPVFPFYYLFTILCAVQALRLWLATGAAEDPESRRVRLPVTLGILVPIVFASATDAILPMAGIQLPRLGTASFAMLSALILWNNLRGGDFFGSPAVFAREILHTLSDGVVLVSPRGQVLVANEGLERLLGASYTKIVGTPFDRWVPGVRIDPEEDLLGLECELRPDPETGSPIPVALLSSALRDWQGRARGSVVVIRDLRELTSLRDRLVTSGRLAAVGQLAAGIAHEINNPIAFVRANLGLLRRHWQVIDKELAGSPLRQNLADLLAEGEEVIDESLEGIDRAAAIVRDVREFSHAGDAAGELADLNQLLDSVLRVAAPELHEGIRLERSYGYVPAIPCSPQQLKQVFLNLIVNAIHAVDGEGCVSVTTESTGGAVVVRVEDDGCGISEEVMERIFDPFFTTKPVGKGTGLGLSISHEIIRSHGGEIRVSSQPGRGTCFQVRLPAVSRTEARSR
ncbi:MAG: ATP-binding protein [Proteobacteria bacterium]|nr:ATP-binding protein [Pseudomonadota bacterium]